MQYFLPWRKSRVKDETDDDDMKQEQETDPLVPVKKDEDEETDDEPEAPGVVNQEDADIRDMRYKLEKLGFVWGNMG